MTKQRPVQIANRRDGSLYYWLGKLLVFMFAVLTCIGLVSSFLLFRYVRDYTPKVDDFSAYRENRQSRGAIKASDGTVLGEFASEWREFVAFEDIPKPLINAFLAAEDHEFFEHHGIYYTGIIRAAIAVISSGDAVQGGSTISQQVAKMYLSRDKSFWRKAREALLARRLERTYSKKAILTVYLNEIYLGSGAYGVKAAAKRYFSKELGELSVGEMALLAGLARRPASDSPIASLQRANARKNQVLKKMVRYGFLKDAAAKQQASSPIVVNSGKKSFSATSPYFAEHIRREIGKTVGPRALTDDRISVETTVDPVVDAATYENVRFGIRKQDKRQGWRGPVKHLSVDDEINLFLERQLELYGDSPLMPNRRYLALVDSVTANSAEVIVGGNTYQLPLEHARWASRWKIKNPVNQQRISSLKRALSKGDVVWVKRLPESREEFEDWTLDGSNPRWLSSKTFERAENVVALEQTPHPQAAIFTGDHRTGYVEGMVGGEDFSRSVYNRTTQSCRSPGSTYKPIYYSAALEEGYGFDTILKDKPHEVATVNETTGEVWTPENFGGSVDDEVSMEYSLVFSKNASSVDIFQRIGAKNVEAWARKLGFTTEIIADRALALGASCTILSELTGAFGVFAQNGKRVPWRYIKSIRNADGEIISDNAVYEDPWLFGERRVSRFLGDGSRGPQVMSPRAAFLTSKLLHKVVTHGFSSILRKIEIPAAGKTGTSSDTMDMAFVGFTSRRVISALYLDDRRIRPLGLKDAAYKTVLPLWSRYVHDIESDYPHPKNPWVVPEGIKEGDRGAHKKGKRFSERMSLTYRKKVKLPDDAEIIDGKVVLPGAAPAPQ